MIREMVRGALAVLLFPAAAHASVIYEWQSVSSGLIPALDARVVLSDAAVSAGFVSYRWPERARLLQYDFCRQGGGPLSVCLADPGAPVEQTQVQGIAAGPIDLRPPQGLGLPVVLFAPYWGIDVRGNRLFSGEFFLTNDNVDIRFSGDNGLWGVSRYIAPTGYVCGERVTSSPNTPPPIDCGVAGRFVEARVPVAGTLALLALGSFGFAAIRRDRTRLR